MIVSFIEEERIRQQLKNLMEDDEKRKRGVFAVLKRDRRLANDWMHLNDTYSYRDNMVVVNRLSQLKRAKGILNGVQMENIPVIDVEHAPKINKPKPTVKRLVKQTNAINNINASLEAYNSRIKTNIGSKVHPNSSSSAGLIRSSSNAMASAIKSQPTETTKKKAIRKTLPRSNSNIDKSISISPQSSPPPPTLKKGTKKNIVTSVPKPVKPLSSNAKFKIQNNNTIPTVKPQIKSAKSMVQKNLNAGGASNASGATSAGNAGTTLTNSMGLKKSVLPNKPTLPNKPMLPKKNSKIMERPLPQPQPQAIKSGGKVTNKKSLKSNISVNVEVKEKPFSGRSRQKLATVPPKARSAFTAITTKPQDDFSSTLEQIGKVKALVEKIKSLSAATLKTEENVINVSANEKKRKVQAKMTPKAITSPIKQPAAPLKLPEPIKKPEESEEDKSTNSSDDNFTLDIEEQNKSADNDNEKKSEFNIDTKELQGLIKEQNSTKKAKLDPKYYSMKGFFGDRNDEMIGVPTVDNDSDDIESVALYSDSEASSNYTLQDDPDISSDDSLLLDTFDFDTTNESNDPDYELPKNEVEDLVIHKGTASIRDLIRDENKLFDSDDDESKIVEIPQKNRFIKSIKQPKAYCKEELMKLTVYTTAASSSQIRKRHLALKSENNDLQSQKSVPKMNLRNRKKTKTSDMKNKSKSRFQLINDNNSDQNKEEITNEPMINKKTKSENVLESLIIDNEEQKEQKEVSHNQTKFESKINKIDSCPLLDSFAGNNKQSDFGIPTIRSAEPKFNIFKSQASMDDADDKMQDSNSDDEEKEICPQLVKIRNEVVSSKSDLRKQIGKTISSGSSSSDSDTTSVASIDVNLKYLCTLDDGLTTDDEMPQIPVAVIDATQCPFQVTENETAPDTTKSEIDTRMTCHDESFISDDPIETMDIDSNKMSDILTNINQVSEQDAFVLNSKTILNSNILTKSTNPFDEDDDEVKDVETLRESCQSFKINTQKQSNHSTNPFENEDLIIFSDDTPPSALNSKDNTDNHCRKESFNQILTNDKQIVDQDENYVDNLVNNNLHQCVMYSIQTPNTLKRAKLGENDFQFVRYVPVGEPNPPELPIGTANGNSSNSSDSSFDSGSDDDVFSDPRPLRDPRFTDAIPNSVPKIQRKEYLNLHTNSLVSRKVLLLLRNPIFIYGTVKLTVLIGTVEVFGYKAGPGENLEIFSPKGFSLLQIVPLCNDESVDDEEDQLRECLENVKDHFTTLDLRNMRRHFVPKTDAIIVLHRNNERVKLTQNFTFFMNENVFPKIKSFNSKPPFGGSEHLLKCRILPETDQFLKIPLSWSTFSIFKHKRVIVAGGKGVGKSTFIRYVINKHLPVHEKILLIDLDIGQPEIFVPQTVSYTVIKKPLLGPGFFLNKQPHKAYVVGHTNVVMCPMVYKNAVKSLIMECHVNDYLRDMPWMVNTMGYNKGFGAELMAMIAELVQPTDMVQIESQFDINNFDIPLDHKNLTTQAPRFIDDDKEPGVYREIMPYTLHKFASVSRHGTRHNKNWAMSAKDVRYSMLIARLSDALYGEAQMLTDCKPLWISFNKIHLYNAVTNYQNKSELLRTIEGNLVYLGSYVDDAKPIECYGIGVVRAVDFQAEKLYLVPAMPYEYMYYVNCLVIGEMCLPASVFKNQGYKVTNNVPYVFETDDGKASKAIKQVFHRPSEFLLGSKQSFDA